MTRPWTEEEIAALIDGSIEDDAEADALRRVLETDRDAQAVAARIERSNALLKSAFPIPEASETPAAIRTALLAEPGKVAALPPRRRWTRFVPAAAAACIALAVGIGVGPLLQPGGETPVAAGPPSMAGAEFQTLEGLASGEAAPDGLTPTLTFLDEAGRVCREFERVDRAAGLYQTGVAGRSDAGTWRALTIVTTAPQWEESQGFAPASGAGDSLLSPVLDRLGAGEPLPPEQEAALIRNGWRQSE